MKGATIPDMKFGGAAYALLLLCGISLAQNKPVLQSEPVTVPAAIDHNRVVINAEIPLPNGSTERVRAWVDNGNPDLSLSRRLATLLGLEVSCNDRECSSSPPKEIMIGGMTISLTGSKEAKIPLKPVNAEYNHLTQVITSTRLCGNTGMPVCSGTDIAGCTRPV